MMERPNPSQEQFRYTSKLRHYHRSASDRKRTWDQWVDGPAAPPRKSRKILRNTLIVLGLIALVVIIGGLIIELK